MSSGSESSETGRGLFQQTLTLRLLWDRLSAVQGLLIDTRLPTKALLDRSREVRLCASGGTVPVRPQLAALSVVRLGRAASPAGSVPRIPGF